MAPMTSEFRQRGRTEPTDAQKTARIAMIRRRQSMQRLGLGNAYPTPSNQNPKDNVAFTDTGAETWARPEPLPLYDENFKNSLKSFENKSYEEEKLELRLKELNADIKAMEAAGEQLGPNTQPVKEAIETYEKLNTTRGDLRRVGNEISKGIEPKYRSNIWPAGIGAGTVALLGVIGAVYFRSRARRTGGRRYVQTKDRLSIFGNF